MASRKLSNNNNIPSFKKFKVALNWPPRIFKTLLIVLSQIANYHSTIKKWGSPSSFLRCKQVKMKYRVFLENFHVAIVTYYVTVVDAFC